MDGQCLRRFRRKKNTIIYGIWKNQEQRSLEKYNKGLIISKLMEEKKEEEKKKKSGPVDAAVLPQNVY